MLHENSSDIRKTYALSPQRVAKERLLGIFPEDGHTRAAPLHGQHNNSRSHTRDAESNRTMVHLPGMGCGQDGSAGSATLVHINFLFFLQSEEEEEDCEDLRHLSLDPAPNHHAQPYAHARRNDARGQHYPAITVAQVRPEVAPVWCFLFTCPGQLISN